MYQLVEFLLCLDKRDSIDISLHLLAHIALDHTVFPERKAGRVILIHGEDFEITLLAGNHHPNS